MRVSDLRRCAMSWPEATEQPHFQFTSFRVRGKIFATVPPGQDRLHLFVGDRVREQALAMHPQWAHKLLWKSKVVGLRIDLAMAAPAVVKQLIGKRGPTRHPKRYCNIVMQTESTRRKRLPAKRSRRRNPDWARVGATISLVEWEKSR